VDCTFSVLFKYKWKFAANGALLRFCNNKPSPAVVRDASLPGEVSSFVAAGQNAARV
jgi:hypothetical protein